MIYTLTLNPCLDYNISVDEIAIGDMNRISEAEIYAGGKGINVAIVLARLGIPVTALGFLGGRNGASILAQVQHEGVITDFVPINEENRTNIKIRDKNGRTTEINSRGPKIHNRELSEIQRKLDQIEDDDFLVISGSVPEDVPVTIYRDLARYLQQKNVHVIIDASGELLRYGLEAKPFLIKPNREELATLFDIKHPEELDEKTIEKYLLSLIDHGVEQVIVSLGKDGAAFMDQSRKLFIVKAPTVNVVSAVGSGDSLIAGFLAEYITANDALNSLKLGVASGTATSTQKWLANKADIEKIRQIID